MGWIRVPVEKLTNLTVELLTIYVRNRTNFATLMAVVTRKLIFYAITLKQHMQMFDSYFFKICMLSKTLAHEIC